MTSPSIWSSGRYEAVGERIAGIAADVVDAVARRVALDCAAVVDLACGTGNAALAAAVDMTPELLAMGAVKPASDYVTWVTADASDTGLPDRSYDAVVSNIGVIFVEPGSQVAELGRLLRPGGVAGFSAWSSGGSNPFCDPIVDVLGPPPPAEFRPDQWGDPETIATRLSAGFDEVEIEPGVYTWRFDSLASAVHFVSQESPTHVNVFRHAGQA